MKKKEFTFKTNGGTTTVTSNHDMTGDQKELVKNPGYRQELYSKHIIPSPVEHPEHYNKGIECWDYVVSHNMGFLEGNIIKYVTRYKHKNGKADLLKAKEYLDKLLEQVE